MTGVCSAMSRARGRVRLPAFAAMVFLRNGALGRFAPSSRLGSKGGSLGRHRLVGGRHWDFEPNKANWS